MTESTFAIGSRLFIVEGIHGNWMYHLSETGENAQPALCGYKMTMHSHSTLNTWNMEPTHIRYKFCNKCHEISVSRGFHLPEATTKTLIF